MTISVIRPDDRELVAGQGRSLAINLSWRVDGVRLPFAGDALELVLAPVLEHKARPRHEVLDRAGNEYFTWLPQRNPPHASASS